MEKRYKLGLALSGGGARGFAHCGAILALEEFGLKPDIVAGTSAGAIAGSAYCAGRTPIDIAEGFMGREFSDFASLVIPRTGFFNHESLLNLIREWTMGKHFHELDIPMKVVACNLDKGECVAFEDGDLAMSVLASSSIPVVFKPVIIGGVCYVDGGVFRNLPVTPIREECQRVIAVDVWSASFEESKMNIIDIAMRSFSYMFNANASTDISLCDIYINLDIVQNYTMFDLNNINEIFRAGYLSTVEQLENRYAMVRKTPSRLRDLTTPEERENRSSVKRLRNIVKEIVE